MNFDSYAKPVENGREFSLVVAEKPVGWSPHTKKPDLDQYWRLRVE